MKDEHDNGYRKPNSCPFCSKFVDAATRPEDLKDVPEPGCLSVCIHCREVSMFTEDMTLEKFDLNLLTLEDAQHINKIQNAIVDSKKWKI